MTRECEPRLDSARRGSRSPGESRKRRPIIFTPVSLVRLPSATGSFGARAVSCPGNHVNGQKIVENRGRTAEKGTRESRRRENEKGVRGGGGETGGATAASPMEHDLQAITRIVRSAIIRIAFSVRSRIDFSTGACIARFNRCFDSAWTRGNWSPHLSPAPSSAFLPPRSSVFVSLLSFFYVPFSRGNGKLDSVCWRCIRAAISRENRGKKFLIFIGLAYHLPLLSLRPLLTSLFGPPYRVI